MCELFLHISDLSTVCHMLTSVCVFC